MRKDKRKGVIMQPINGMFKKNDYSFMLCPTDVRKLQM